MRIKICGVTHATHVETAAAAGAAMVGFVFAERGHRHLTVEQAKRLGAVLPPRSEPVMEVLAPGGEQLWFRRCAIVLDELIGRGRPLLVGVFANQPAALVNAIAEAVDLDLIQLSGTERWEMCLQMRRPVIKTVRAAPGMSAVRMRTALESGMAHLLHLDSYVPGEMGGTGQLAPWDVAAALASEVPLMLAGGLNPGNVGEAVQRVRPWAVDVSSGVERDGVKDVELIDEFVRAARGAAVGMGTDDG